MRRARDPKYLLAVNSKLDKLLVVARSLVHSLRPTVCTSLVPRLFGDLAVYDVGIDAAAVLAVVCIGIALPYMGRDA